MSLCDILYFVPVLPALSSLPTLPGHVLGRCQKKSGQGQQSQLALGQLSLVPAGAALCADVGISRVHLNRKLKEFGLEPPSVLIRKCRMKQAARLLVVRGQCVRSSLQDRLFIAFILLQFFPGVFLSLSEGICDQASGESGRREPAKII